MASSADTRVVKTSPALPTERLLIGVRMTGLAKVHGGLDSLA
jgi:hypothetical protein